MKKGALFWVLAIGGGLMAMCCLLSFVFLGFGAFLGADDSGGGLATTTTSSGGFEFTPPPSFTPAGQGRFKARQVDGTTTNAVEIIRLPDVNGRDDAERKLQQLWNEQILRDWDKGQPNPVVMRRFVANGARAVFSGAELSAKDGSVARVTLFLVDNDEALTPLVFIQTSHDPDHLAVTQDMFARYTWVKSWPLAEEAIQHIKGSPIGEPLVPDDEILGTWSYGTGSQLQWVNTFSGRTGMDVVSYSIAYTFTVDHRYTYKFSGASGTVGSLRFQGDAAEGEWNVTHDVLTLTSDEGKKTEYLLLGAPVSPEGTRLLYLLPRPHWTLEPSSALANGELYAPK